MFCQECKWWQYLSTAQDSDPDKDFEDDTGFCHRYPPKPKMENDAEKYCWDSPPLAHSERDWSFPIVKMRDYCGEFTPTAPTNPLP